MSDPPPATDEEETTQLWLPPWQWPLADPDEEKFGDALAEARHVLRDPTEPDLPILEAVLDELYRLRDRDSG